MAAGDFAPLPNAVWRPCRTAAEGFLHSYDIIRSAEQITCASPAPARSPHPDSMATWSSVTFDSPVHASWARSDSTRTPAFFVEQTRCGSRYRLA